jgi:hypothetical protein
VVKFLVSGAALAVLSAGLAHAAARPAVAPWVIQPADAACHVELELKGRSGAVVPVTLVSDGERLVLRFAKDDLPERAFLPVRVDRKPFSNIMRRTAEPAIGEITLSEDTQAALRKGATFSIAWLAEEPVSVALGGSDQGVPDLKTCGAQVAGEARARAAAEQAAAERAQAEAREKALAEAQLKAARAQAAAAEAERDRQAQAAAREQALAQQARAEAAERQRLALQAQEEEDYQAQRQRAYDEARRRYQMEQEALPPAPQPYYPPPPAAYRWGRY